MDPSTFPTKGNLILAKNTLKMSRQGYELLDKKRNVLIREIMDLNQRAKDIQASIDRIFNEAYASLQKTNITMGIASVERMSYGVPLEESIGIKTRSIMGVEIPHVTYTNSTDKVPVFAMGNTTSEMDESLARFNAVKDLIIRLSMIEIAAYRLAMTIKKTQRRANALKNVTIPRCESLVKSIQETLEERERDEFTRLKVIKRRN
jgi:V/A-type H+-transporting ATPase subunit D